MPGMTGFDLQKRMNELASRFNIIIITADAQPGDRDHAVEAGAIGFLQKPFQEEPLLELISLALDKET
jgi:two-component system response regulator FixJ